MLESPLPRSDSPLCGFLSRPDSSVAEPVWVITTLRSSCGHEVLGKLAGIVSVAGSAQ